MILILVVASMLLTACGGEATTSPTPTLDSTPVFNPTPTAPVVVGEVVTIRFAVYDWERSRYEDLAKAFAEDNPGLRVQLVSLEETLGLTPDDFTWPAEAWLRLASGADVINLPPDREAVRQGLVRELTPFIDANANFQPDDFYPGTLTQYQWDGGTWGIPTALNYQLIYYDKQAFDQTGLPYPEPGWTWDDFLATAKTLTLGEGDTVTRWGFVQPWPGHLQFIDNRVTLIDPSTDPPTPRFDQPDVMDAVRWYAALYREHQVTPYFAPDSSGTPVSEGEQLIENGQAAMWHGNSSRWQWHKEQNTQVELGVVPYPVDAPDSRTTLMSTEGLSMSAGTAHPDAAWRWIDFLSRQVLFDFEAEGASQLLPARRSVAESSGFWDQANDELARALRYAIDHSYTSTGQPGYEAFSEAVDAILKGEKSVEDALAEAQAQAKAEIQETLARQAQATPIPTLVVAGAEEETTSEGAVTITFLVGFGDTDLGLYGGLAQRFHETNPGIAVRVTAPDFTSGSIDIPTVAQDADCFVWGASFHDPKNLDAILSLDPFLDADPSFTTADFFPSLLDRFVAQGQLWALPAEVAPYVIEYNKDLFDAGNLAYPRPDWNMDDFLALAIALTKGKGEGKQYGFAGQADESTLLQLMIERLGARLIDDGVDPPTVAFDDPATIEAMRWYVDLHTQYAVKPLFLSDRDFASMDTLWPGFLEREALINAGRAAMWTKFEGQPDPGAYIRHETMNIGAVPLPVGKGRARSSSYLATGGYFISAHTEARQACWQWITFLTGQPDAVRGLPARRSVAESDAYRQRVGSELAAAYLASLGDTDPFASLEGRNSWLGWEASFWLLRAYSQAVAGEAIVDQALADAQDMAEDYRACVISRDALADWKQQEACVKEVDPTFPDFFLLGSDDEN